MQTIDKIDKVALKKDLELLLNVLENAKIARWLDTSSKTLIIDNTSCFGLCTLINLVILKESHHFYLVEYLKNCYHKIYNQYPLLYWWSPMLGDDEYTVLHAKQKRIDFLKIVIKDLKDEILTDNTSSTDI